MRWRTLLAIVTHRSGHPRAGAADARTGAGSGRPAGGAEHESRIRRERQPVAARREDGTRLEL